MRKLVFRVIRVLSLTMLSLSVWFLLFQHRLIYFPSPSSAQEIAEFVASGGQRIDFTTSQGRQTAWLQIAQEAKTPERFWIVCGGNGTRALQLADLQKNLGLEKDAFLLVDYPGYGASEGKASPMTIQENLQAAIPLASEAAGFSVTDLPSKGIVFGHSLGCAAALLGAEMYGIKRAVLLAPFTSTMDMSAVVLRLPLGHLVRHRFDNRQLLEKLAVCGGHAWIFHGERDEAIPSSMGRELAKQVGTSATYREVRNGSHNDLFDIAGAEIARAMHEARQ